MNICIKRKILLGILFVFSLFLLTACGGKGNKEELVHPSATEAQKETEEKKAETSDVKALEDVNEIPSDGIITKEQFATVAGQDREIRFVGETDEGISYTWTYKAAQIQNPEDQNLKIDFDSEDLDEIKKQANNANDALKMTMHGKGLICPPTLTVEIPEAWQSDMGMLLKEQNSKLAKMSDVTIKSQQKSENSKDSSDDNKDSEESSEDDTAQQSQDTKSLTEPAEGTTTFTMTVLSLDGDSYIVGGITDVNKLAAINQQAQSNASANANGGNGADNSAGNGQTSSGNGSTSYADNGGSYDNGNTGSSDGSNTQPGADIPADIANSGTPGNSGSGSSGNGASGDIANNDNSSGGSGSGGGGSSSGGSGNSSANTCTISISCSTILNNKKNLTKGKEEFVPSDGWILKPVTVSFSSGESVHDVLQRVCKDKGIHMESQYTPAYDSAYVEGINQLYEFDCGELSGWMYSVNGWFPNYGCSKYTVSNGDTISWVYTCDLGKDVGDNSMY